MALGAVEIARIKSPTVMIYIRTRLNYMDTHKPIAKQIRWRLTEGCLLLQFVYSSIPRCTKQLRNSAHMISPPRLFLFSACNIENVGVAWGQGYKFSAARLSCMILDILEQAGFSPEILRGGKIVISL